MSRVNEKEIERCRIARVVVPRHPFMLSSAPAVDPDAEPTALHRGHVMQEAGFFGLCGLQSRCVSW
jgi:hypothetical protein